MAQYTRVTKDDDWGRQTKLNKRSSHPYTVSYSLETTVVPALSGSMKKPRTKIVNDFLTNEDGRIMQFRNRAEAADACEEFTKYLPSGLNAVFHINWSAVRYVESNVQKGTYGRADSRSTPFASGGFVHTSNPDRDEALHDRFKRDDESVLSFDDFLYKLAGIEHKKAALGLDSAIPLSAFEVNVRTKRFIDGRATSDLTTQFKASVDGGETWFNVHDIKDLCVKAGMPADSVVHEGSALKPSEIYERFNKGKDRR